MQREHVKTDQKQDLLSDLLSSLERFIYFGYVACVTGNPNFQTLSFTLNGCMIILSRIQVLMGGIQIPPEV